MPGSSLEIAQFNANSRLGHIDIVRTYFESNFFHIISVCETWLYSLIRDDLVMVNDFFIIRKDREGKRGGGVAVYIHKSLKVKWLAASPGLFTNSHEFLMLEIRSPDNDALLFISLYRRPRGTFFDDFLETYKSFSHVYENIRIAGDVNCALHAVHFESSCLKDLVYSLSLHLVDSAATYHTATSDSWLDIIVFDSEHKVLSFAKSEAPFIAGHDLLRLEYAFDARSTERLSLTRRCFSGLDEVAFFDAIRAGLIGSNIYFRLDNMSADDIDCVVELFADAYESALDSLVPRKSFIVSRPAAPWSTRELRDRVRERLRLYKRARRSGSVLGYAIYRDYRDRLTADLRSARSEYQLNRVSAARDPKLLWRELRRIGLVKPTLRSPLHFFQANELNEYYASISSRDPGYSRHTFQSIIVSAERYEPSDRPLFCLNAIDTSAIRLQVDLLPSSHCAGPDGILPFCIKNSLPVVLEFATGIFNESLRLSIFPRIWKKAFIRPLFKMRSPKTPSDTRPVANLSDLSKVFERIVHKQIVSYAETYNIFDPRQSGYRTGYSKQTTLIRVCDDIRRAINERCLTILVLFDSSKAFDTIFHSLLLRKLKTIGFSDSALAWVFSYLTGRSQAVVDGSEVCSDWLLTSAGVPQGSVLGPLLFSLFIADIPVNLTFAKGMIFADDTQIHLSIPFAQLNEGVSKIAHDISVISDYATTECGRETYFFGRLIKTKLLQISV